MNEKDIIAACARELRLATLRENVELFLEDAVREQWRCLTFLRRLLEEEVAKRHEKSKTTRIHRAGFPQMKYLEDLEREELPIEGQMILPEVETLDFIKEGAEMLFNHLSLRTGKKATIITTNLPFTRWEEVLKDKVLCSALVDRLYHKSYLVNMTGASYRVKETKKIINKANV